MEDITQDQADYIEAHYRNYGDRKLARVLGKSKEWVKRARIEICCLRTREERKHIRAHGQSAPCAFEPTSDLPYVAPPPNLSRLGKAAVAISFILPLLIYLATIAPGPAGATGAQLAACAAAGYLPHSPACPLYLLVAQGIGALPSGDLAFRLNLLSAFTGALASMFSMLICYQLTHKPAVSLGFSLFIAFSTSMWRASVTTSAIMPAYLCATIACYFLVRFCETRRAKSLLIAVAAAGAAVAIHPWLSLFAPAFFLPLWICHKQRRFEPGLWAGIFVIALFALQFFVYLPFLGKPQAELHGFAGTVAYILGNPTWLWDSPGPSHGFLSNILDHLDALQQSLWPVSGWSWLSWPLNCLALLACGYGAYLLRRNRPIQTFLITCVILGLAALFLFAVRPLPQELDVSALLLPLAWAAFLLATIALSRFDGTTKLRSAIFAAIATALLFSQGYSHWNLSSYRNWDFPDEYGKTLWQNIPDHAVLVPPCPTSYYYLLYSRPLHKRVEILDSEAGDPGTIIRQYPNRPLYCGWIKPGQDFSRYRVVREGLMWRIVPIAQGFAPRPTALGKFPPLSANLSPGERRLLARCHFIRMRDMIEKGEADEALGSYRETGEEQGEARKFMLDFARDLSIAKKHDQALVIYRRLTDDAPQANVYVAMARIRGIQGMSEEAIKLYRKALELAPGHFQALLELARLLEKSESWEEAISLYRDLIEKYPQASYPHRRLAEILARDPAYQEKAAELAEKAKDLEQREAEQRRLPEVSPRANPDLFRIEPKLPEIPRPRLPLPPVGPKLPETPK